MISSKSRPIWFIITITILVLGCQKNDFKSSCMKARDILECASSFLHPNVENKKNGTRNIVVRFDNSKAIEYIEKNDEKLKQNYNIIKNSLDSSGNNYYDAIFAASYINEMYYFITGQTLDNRCLYIELIKDHKHQRLSDWLINDFFAPFRDEKYKKNWINMPYDEKKEIILDMLITSKKKRVTIRPSQFGSQFGNSNSNSGNSGDTIPNSGDTIPISMPKLENWKTEESHAQNRQSNRPGLSSSHHPAG